MIRNWDWEGKTGESEIRKKKWLIKPQIGLKNIEFTKNSNDSFIQ